jgi:hypothetical protein
MNVFRKKKKYYTIYGNIYFSIIIIMIIKIICPYCIKNNRSNIK